MSRTKYHKLVRDKIPEIIEQSGKTCTCRILSEEEYITLLDEKLNEEVAEYQESKSIEELADILEVIHAIAATRHSSIDEIEDIRKIKVANRGGFRKKILLEEVTEP